MTGGGPTAASPGLVALIGAPRSGTSWLQGLLGAHPRIASPQETDLFTRYVAPVEAAWQWQLRGDVADWRTRRFKGLPAVLRADELHHAGRAFVDEIVAAMRALKPGADIVLEKSPSHSLHVATIITYAPTTRFVHLVRDGRDVVASIQAAGHGWGAWWAPTDVASAAALWVDHTRSARDATEAPGGYLEVRYEVLRARGAAALADVFAFIGVTTDEHECEALIAEQAVVPTVADIAAPARPRARGILVGGEFAPYAGEPEPGGFVRHGATGSWRSAWSLADRVRFDAVAGALLIELGYEPDRSWVGGPIGVAAQRGRDTARQVAARATGAAGRRISRMSKILEGGGR